MIRRRAFITLLGSTVAAWPLAARAQQGERMRRIGVCMNLAADDPEGQARLTAFAQGLQQLGWTDGRNARIEYRWAVGDAERIRKQAEELVTLAPDVILASGVPVVWRCCRRPAACRSCSRRSSIPSARGWSPVWRGPAETSPALPCSNSV